MPNQAAQSSLDRAASTQAFGLNNEDDVVGAYVDAQGLTHGFIFDDGHFQSVDDPNGVGTTLINGINNRGQVVGFFVDGAGNTDGFVCGRRVHHNFLILLSA